MICPVPVIDHDRLVNVEEALVSHSPFVSLQSFRRDRGESADPDSCVFAAPVPSGRALVTHGSAGRWLVATVEPVDKTNFGWSVASQALEALRQGFAAQYDSTVSQALARGFAAANACVRAANRGELGHRGGERVYVGASAIALDGPNLIFAHVPPSQIVFTQDRMVYTIPALHSWEPHYAGSDRTQAEPLGARDQVAPNLFQTTVAERDTIVLCSTSLGRAISGLPALAERLKPPTDPAGRPLTSLPVGPAEHPVTMLDMGPVRPTGLDPALAWVDWLDHVAAERQVPTCHAIAATIGQVESRSSRGSAGQRHPRERANRPSAEPDPVAGTPRFVLTDDLLDRAGRPRMMNVPVPPVDVDRHLGLRRLPGAHGVSRFAGGDRLLARSWRVRVPRFELRQEFTPPRWIAATIVLVLLLASGAGVGYLRSSAIARDRLDALSAIDGQLARADADQDASELGLVRGQLSTLAAKYGPSTDLESRQVRLYSIEDQLLGRSRLNRPVELGQLPAESIPTDRPVRLLHAGTSVFVVGTALYELSPDGDHLIRLLGAGDVIGGQTAGLVVDAVATRSGLAVTDGVSLFNRDDAGRWSAEPFDAELDLTVGGAAAIALYDDQMVAIDRSTGRLVSVPIGERATGGTPSLPSSVFGSSGGALDLAVGTDLFVLGAGGELTAFDRLGSDRSLSVPVTPELSGPRAMDTDSGDLWILDTGNGAGRLIQYVPSDDHAKTYELPVAGPNEPGPLSTASDFVIDPANGQVVFIVDQTLWSTPLPATA